MESLTYIAVDEVKKVRSNRRGHGWGAGEAGGYGSFPGDIGYGSDKRDDALELSGRGSDCGNLGHGTSGFGVPVFRTSLNNGYGFDDGTGGGQGIGDGSHCNS